MFKQPKNYQESECPICLEPILKLSKFKGCDHVICTRCADSLRAKSSLTECILCRTISQIDDLKDQCLIHDQHHTKICLTCKAELICDECYTDEHLSHDIVNKNGTIKLKLQFDLVDVNIQDIREAVKQYLEDSHQNKFFIYPKLLEFLQFGEMTIDLSNHGSIEYSIKRLKEILEVLDTRLIQTIDELDSLVDILITQDWDQHFKENYFFNYTKLRFESLSSIKKHNPIEKIQHVCKLLTKFGPNLNIYHSRVLGEFCYPLFTQGVFLESLALFNQSCNFMSDEIQIILDQTNSSKMRLNAIVRVFDVTYSYNYKIMFSPLFSFQQLIVSHLINTPCIAEFLLFNSQKVKEKGNELCKHVLDFTQKAYSKCLPSQYSPTGGVKFDNYFIDYISFLMNIENLMKEAKKEQNIPNLNTHLFEEYSIETEIIQIIIGKKGYPKQVAKIHVPEDISSKKMIKFIESTLNLQQDQHQFLAFLKGQDKISLAEFNSLDQFLEQNPSLNKQFILFQEPNVDISDKEQFAAVTLVTKTGFQISCPNFICIDPLDSFDIIQNKAIQAYKIALIELYSIHTEEILDSDIELDVLKSSLESNLDLVIRTFKDGLKISFNDLINTKPSELNIQIEISNIFNAIESLELFKTLKTINIYHQNIEGAVNAMKVQEENPNLLIVDVNIKELNPIKEIIEVNGQGYQFRGGQAISDNTYGIFVCAFSNERYTQYPDVVVLPNISSLSLMGKQVLIYDKIEDNYVQPQQQSLFLRSEEVESNIDMFKGVLQGYEYQKEDEAEDVNEDDYEYDMDYDYEGEEEGEGEGGYDENEDEDGNDD